MIAEVQCRDNCHRQDFCIADLTQDVALILRQLQRIVYHNLYGYHGLLVHEDVWSSIFGLGILSVSFPS